MKPDTASEQGTASSDPEAEAAAPPPPLGEVLASLWRATVARHAARWELISLDVRRAGLSLGQVIVFSLLCAFTVWTAWFATMAGLVWLVGHFTDSYAAGLLLVIALNLLAMGWLWQQVIRLAHHLTLPEVRAHILSAPHE